MARDTNNMNYAMIMAESGAEAFKAIGDNPERLAELLNGTSGHNIVEVFYCASWRITSSEDAVIIMTMSIRGGDFGLSYCDISVVRLDFDLEEGETIITLTVANRGS
jgi:hypothetical protein